jgi:hypothetical protein
MARKELFDKKFVGAVVEIGPAYVLIIVLLRKTLGGRAAARPTACGCRRLTAGISPTRGVSTRLLAARGKAAESEPRHTMWTDLGNYWEPSSSLRDNAFGGQENVCAMAAVRKQRP